MAEFVINLWNQFSSAVEFENEIPLLANGRRMARLGIRNRVHVCFLAGMERLPSRYLDEVREMGFTVHDVSALAAECETRVPLLVERYRNWGGIKHFGLLRFLTMPRLFGRDTSIITFDGDMVINAPLDEIEQVLGGTFCFLSNSSCFGSMPAASGFFQTFEDHLLHLVRDPEPYAQQVMKLPSADAFFDPHQSGGTDQAFILHLFRQGIVPQNNAFELCTQAGLLPFASWLLLDELGLRGLTYERRDGIDYLGGKKVLISHMSHDTCTYFGQFVFLRRVFGDEGMEAFGRIPLLYKHYARDEGADQELVPWFRRLFFLATERYPNVKRMPTNPFWRSRIVECFYEETDFRHVLNDRVWHTPGVFT